VWTSASEQDSSHAEIKITGYTHHSNSSPAVAVFSKMSSIEHFRAVDHCIISVEFRNSPETNMSMPVVEHPRNHLNGNAVALRTEAHEIGKTFRSRGGQT
jgi:hypothetical protein